MTSSGGDTGGARAPVLPSVARPTDQIETQRVEVILQILVSVSLICLLSLLSFDHHN